MNKGTKDNKGFSLVELIVVILIMAILAVALTPQVMKWVNNSRISADADTIEAVKAAVALAYTNDTVYSKATGEITITLKDGSTGNTSSITDGTTYASGDPTFTSKFEEYAGGSISSFALKQAGQTYELKYTKGILTSATPSADFKTSVSD